ncbi:MAG: hypothetical protein H3C27_08540 [Opitutaceae bacterium]|nr:hypothetical protein [Opitutaceae bacterium]
MNESRTLLHTLVGISGTLASLTLESINTIAGILAGLATAAYMTRKLWLSWKKPSS